MAVKTYGTLKYLPEVKSWYIYDCEPHISMRLKQIFPKIPKTSKAPYSFSHTDENCHDLKWFIARYPLEISAKDWRIMCSGSANFKTNVNLIEQILAPERKHREITLKNGFSVRPYQQSGSEAFIMVKRMLLGDDLGLGKSLTSVLPMFSNKTLPALVVVQSHLADQWAKECIELFTNLKCYIVKGTKPYNLPPADVYVIRYTCLTGWMDVLSTFIKYVVFDEVQELRHPTTNKYKAAKSIADSATYVQGLSASPIYNYGDEMFYILNLIKPGCLGTEYEFFTEWCTHRGNGKYLVTDPKALGTYLREKLLFLRRTREDVGLQLPPINKIIHTIGYDSEEVRKSEHIAKQLAQKVVRGTFMERGMASREFDIYMRQQTGIAKAGSVAEYVKILLESGEPVVLAGWHRAVYEVWQRELKDYNPVLFTGSETSSQKNEAFRKFVTGETKLLIISLRSGAGLDGLQKVCKYVVVGELDYAPKVHDQLFGRVDRPGQLEQVTAIFLVVDWGSDPPIIDLLGLKSSQSNSIIDPLRAQEAQHSDDGRVKYMAESFLKSRSIV